MIDTKALRKRIIDLAISGKLTESSDSSAIKELETARSVLRNTNQRITREDEKWTVIPQNWTWGRLADLTTADTLNDGNWVLSEDMVPEGEVKLIQLGSIGDCEYRYKGFKFLTEEHFRELNGRQIYPGYLLINRLVVDKMLSCIIPNINGILITAVDVCWVAPRDDIYSIEYLMYVMSSTGVQQKVQELGHGVTRFRISKLNLIDIAFPLPPLVEQRNIVNKINELYRILNRIDELQMKYFNDLVVLKGKVIDAGVRGKMTEQFLADGDAEILYAQIQEEKARLAREGLIKNEKQLSDITENGVPFEIPHNWKWVHMGDIFFHNTGKALNNADGAGKQLKYITTSNMYWDHFELDNLKSMFFKESEIEKCTIRKGDLLICEGGDIGRTAIWNYDFEMRIQNHIHRLRGYGNINHKYYYYVMWNYKENGLIDGRGIGLQGFSSARVHSLVVPLPPLNEQKRIVSQIDSIMSLMDC